jgi:hypothetical protein
MEHNLLITRAWLITREYIEGNNISETFIALLDISIPSGDMLKLSDCLYKATIQSEASSSQDGIICAAYRILNDGSPHTGSIVCGHNPGIYTRWIYDVVFEASNNRLYTMHWREPHIMMYDGVHIVEYWEDFSMILENANINSVLPK